MTKREDTIVKINSGYAQECEWMTLEWDNQGKYRGQWQDDMLGDAGRVFIGTGPGGAKVPDLTTEQMETAQR